VVMRYAALFVVIMIGCSVLGYVVSSLGTAKYGARSEITYPLNGQIPSGTFLRTDRTLQTQLVAMKSQAVLQPVADKFKIPIDTLSKQLTATVLLDSEVIQLEVDDASPARAQAIVGAVVAAYFKNLGPDANTVSEGILDRQIAAIDVQRSSLNDKIATLEANRIAQNPVPAEGATELGYQSQLNDLLTQRSSDETQLSTLTVQEAQQPHVQQLTQPYLLAGKVAPKPLQGAIAGMLAGIMVAALVVGLLIRRLLKRQPDPVG
jgi:capsular polysaccharide biosynthesis protein